LDTPNYLGFLNPIHITWRKGTSDDPYIDRIDFATVVNQRVQLLEIPDKTFRVRINGMVEINYDNLKTKDISPNEFYVDYSNGFILFHQSMEGKTLSISYKGRGFIAYPSERIYHYDEKNNVTESLYNIIENSKDTIQETLNKISDYQEIRNNVVIAINNANIATSNANNSANEAYIASDLAKKAYESTKIVFKPYVQTFNDILTTYPNPEFGWTVQVYDSGIRYRFDGKDWVPIDLLGGNIPKASEYVDGLMSKDDYQKLKSFPVELKDRVLVFVLPSYLGIGVQGVLGRFPFDGEIVSIRAFCGTAGTTDTLISIEKSTDLINWTLILSNNLRIKAGNNFDDNSCVVQTTDVSQGDIFRINVLQSGENAKDFTIEIKIKI